MARARAYRLLSMVHAAEDEYSLAFPLPEGDAPIKVTIISPSRLVMTNLFRFVLNSVRSAYTMR